MGTEGATATLKQFSKTADTSGDPIAHIHRIIFKEIFPTSLSEIALSYDTVSDIGTFEVTWAYQYYIVDSSTN